MDSSSMELDTPARYRTRAATAAAAKKDKATKQRTNTPAAASDPAFPRSLSRLADVELQLVMQFLDADSLLKLARCSRQALHCASHPSVWRNHLVDVPVTSAGPRMDPRATARSLLHFKPSRACLEGNELISCETLAAVPKMAAVRFHATLRLMATSDFQRFFALPVAQRLAEIELTLLAESDTIHQLAALPLLRTVKLALAAGVPLSVLQPLTHAPSLTHVTVTGDGATTPMALLMPLSECESLRRLELIGLLHQPRALRLLMERLRLNGGRLAHFSLSSIAGDIGKLLFDFSAASRFMSHLESLRLNGRVTDFFPSILHLPQLRLLQLQPLAEILCHDSIDELLQMNHTMRVHMQFEQAQLCTPEMYMLAASNPRFQIRFN